MAKGALEIRMDYNQAIRQANSLEQSAKELRKTANDDLQDCISELSHNWTGQNADAYIRKCNTLKAEILATARRIDKSADTIRRIAKNTYDAEMAAYRIASQRRG